jgi:two-component system, sensor histidine kinase LadS
MIYRFLFVALLVFLAPVALPAAEVPVIDIAHPSDQVLGKHIAFLKEESGELGLSEAINAYDRGLFTRSFRAILNFGIDSQPVWLALVVENSLPGAASRRLLLENAWLDHIEVYVRHEGRTVKVYSGGDSQSYVQRATKHRFYHVDHSFEPGVSTLFIRVATPDPMVIPVYLMTPDQAEDRQVWQGYSYGFIYGVIIALLAYNVMIYFGLKSLRYLYYAIYLAAFLIMNMAYTGHGFQWLWRQSPGWQQWSNPVLMIVYGLCGLLFATAFLDTKSKLPAAHKTVKAIAFAFAVLLLLSVLFASQVAGLLVAFVFVFVFSITMLLLGGVSLYRGQKSAKYFLLASVSAMVGASLTAASVWGLIPFNAWTYRAVEVGMMLDAVLLALALGDQFRIGQEEKVQAERLSKVDHLTGLNNRRAFNDAIAPMWSSALRSQRHVSIIMLDIDKFKDINDSFGHAIGDVLLVETAKVLRQACRDADVLARWGGEEFILFLPETDTANAVALAERLRSTIAAIRVNVGGQKIGFTASFGVAERAPDSSDLQVLISAADRLLYEAKAGGRNRVCA